VLLHETLVVEAGEIGPINMVANVHVQDPLE
jgi:hypothetical protein